MKLAINLHLGLLAESFSETLAFSQKLGFDTKTFVETINKTPIGNYISQGKGPKIVEGNFEQLCCYGGILQSSTKWRQKDFSVIALGIQRKNGLIKS